MKLIGYWIRSLRGEEFPPPQELVAQYDLPTRQMVADYLDAGAEFEVYRGLSWCRFGCDHPMGCRELTDGEWVWPVDLSHYVRDHRVRLPDEFVECVRARSPLVAPHEPWSTDCPDESFWKDWCARHRSHALRSKIQAARSQADAEAEQLERIAIAERERTEGLSDEKCQWLGCTNRALQGRAVCAACIVQKTEWPQGPLAPYFNFRGVLEP